MSEKPTEQTRARPGWKERFISRLALRANVSEAARFARVHRTYAYELKKEDPAFAEAWENAIEEAVDRLEQAAWQRATKQSDPLMTLLLKAHRPDRYKDNQQQSHTGEIVIRYVNDWRNRTPEPE